MRFRFTKPSGTSGGSPPSGGFFAITAATYALVPPRMARTLAALFIVVAVAVLAWVQWVDQSTYFGLITQIKQDGDTLLAVLQNPVGDRTVLRLTARVPNWVEVGDIAIVFGTPQERLVEVASLGIAPFSLGDLQNAAAKITETLSHSSTVGVGIMAVVAAVFTPLILRATSGFIVGTALSFVTFVAVHLNAALKIIVFPVDIANQLVAVTALIGAVIGFRAAGRTSVWGWGRMSAVLLASILMGALQNNGVEPAWALWVLPLVALVVPVTSVIAGIIWLVSGPLELTTGEAVVGFLGLLVLSGVIRVVTRSAARTPGMTLHLQPDETGHVPLHHLAKEET